MSEEAPIELLKTVEDFPPATAQVIYVDGITHVAPGPHIVKIHFSRVDISTAKSGEFRMQTVAQLIMPSDAFIQTAQYMNNVVESLINSGLFSQKKVDAIRATAGGVIAARE